MTNQKQQASLSDADRQVISELRNEAAILSQRGSTHHTEPLEKADILLQAAEILLTRKQGSIYNDDRLQLQQQRLATHKRLLDLHRAYPYFDKYGTTMLQISDDILHGRVDQLNQSQSDKAQTLCLLGWSRHDIKTDSLSSSTQEYFLDSLNVINLFSQNRPNQLMEWEKPGENNRLAMAKELMKVVTSKSKKPQKDTVITVMTIFENEVKRLDKTNENRFLLAEAEYQRCVCYYILERVKDSGCVWHRPLTRALTLLQDSAKPLPINMELLNGKIYLLEGKFWLQYDQFKTDTEPPNEGELTYREIALSHLKNARQFLQPLQKLAWIQGSTEMNTYVDECEALIASLRQSPEERPSN